MDRKLLGVILTLIIVFALFLGLVYIGGNVLGVERLKTGERPLLRFVFVAVGLVAAFLLYYFTKQNKAWTVGTREVVYMAIGAALYAVFSYLFNGTVFVVPSVSQVALRPAICIPMFFGYVFGPVVGFFTGAVGNMVGDALTGFGLYPQWSVGNGLIGLIAGIPLLFADKKKSLDTVLIVGAVLTAIATLLFFLFRQVPNTLFYDPAHNIFGDQPVSILVGLSIVVGFILVLIVRFLFKKDMDVATAVTWGMLGNLIGLGFAAISDIWINGYPPPVAIVGEFLPSAGPNLIFAAILVPILIIAYKALQRQTGR
jgi:energy-coupling factor transport system substrate-specific component